MPTPSGRIRLVRRRPPMRKINLRYSRKSAGKFKYYKPRPVYAQVHSFCRKIASPSTLTGNVLYNPYLSNFYLNGISNVVNSGEFTALYDQYRITKVVWKAYMSIDPSAQAAGTAAFPRMYWARDFDSSAAPASIDELRQYGRCKTAILHPNRPVTIVFKPNTLSNIYNTSVTTTYKPVFDQWIDCSNPNTVHYGFPWAINDLTNANYKVDFEITVYFQCKNTR